MVVHLLKLAGRGAGKKGKTGRETLDSKKVEHLTGTHDVWNQIRNSQIASQTSLVKGWWGSQCNKGSEEIDFPEGQ